DGGLIDSEVSGDTVVGPFGIETDPAGGSLAHHLPVRCPSCKGLGGLKGFTLLHIRECADPKARKRYFQALCAGPVVNLETVVTISHPAIQRIDYNLFEYAVELDAFSQDAEFPLLEGWHSIGFP